MKLKDSIELFCSIGEDAIRVLHKKVGKKKGLDAIEQQIRDEATNSAKEAFGDDLDRVAKVHIDRYVSQRMKYMRNAFKKLDNPKTDTSKQRGNFIGDTETKSAREFGRAKGYERLAKSKGKKLFKRWVTGDDPCENCIANEEQGPIPVGEEFQSGDYAPLAHPNCDCELEYTDEEGEEG